MDTLEEQLTSIQEQVEKNQRGQKEELSTDKKDLDSKSDELSALYLENQKLLEAEAERTKPKHRRKPSASKRKKKRPMRPLINGTKITTPL